VANIKLSQLLPTLLRDYEFTEERAPVTYGYLLGKVQSGMVPAVFFGGTRWMIDTADLPTIAATFRMRPKASAEPAKEAA
jgi:hypothetical protein